MASLFAAMVLGIPACGENSTESAGDAAGYLQPSVYDSAGVEVVEVPGEALDSVPRWRFSDEPVLSVGRVDGEDPYLLHRVFAAWRLNSGEVAVADGQSLEVRVFDRDGLFRRRYGGAGEGPGEFRGFPLTVSRADAGHIAIYDHPLERVTGIDLATGASSVHSQTRQCRASGDAGLRPCEITSMLPDGTVLAYRTSPAPPGRTSEEPAIRPGPVRRYGILEGDTLHVFDSIEGPTHVRIGSGGDVFMGPALFESGGAVGAGRAEVVFGDPHRYELRIWDAASGALRRMIRIAAVPEPVTTDLLEQYREWADTASGIPAVARDYLDSVDPEGAVPFFEDLFVDRASRIWVRDYQPFWAFGPQAAAAWTIFGDDGAPRGRIEGGSPGDILEAGEEYALVRETDEFDVEYVRMYRIEPVRQ